MKYLWILFAVFGLGVFSLGCGGGAVTPEIDPDTNVGILNITIRWNVEKMVEYGVDT